MADKDEEQPARSFKVADRRRFVDAESTEASAAETEATRETERTAAHEPPPIVGGGGTPGSAAGSHPAVGEHGGHAPHDHAHHDHADHDHADHDHADHGGAPAEMSFSSFVIGLTTQALMHLGEIVDPSEQAMGRDLPAAKQMIDLLGILRDKTKGNLDQAEAQLLDTMLYDLRMRFVEVSRGR